MYNYKVHITLGDSLRILCNMSVHIYWDARAAGRRTAVPRSSHFSGDVTKSEALYFDLHLVTWNSIVAALCVHRTQVVIISRLFNSINCMLCYCSNIFCVVFWPGFKAFKL